MKKKVLCNCHQIVRRVQPRLRAAPSYQPGLNQVSMRDRILDIFTAFINVDRISLLHIFIFALKIQIIILYEV
jgi:hypothetical protein